MKAAQKAAFFFVPYDETILLFCPELMLLSRFFFNSGQNLGQ